MLLPVLKQMIARELATSTQPKITTCRRLEGKIAVVTGSTMGIGYGIAERFAQEGAKIVICSRSQENVESAVEKLSADGHEVSGVVCNVGKNKDRERLLKEAASKYGRVDCLVANAAVNTYSGPIMDCPESAWDKIFDVNVKSTFMLMKESLPLLRKANSPSIIIVSSIAGYYKLENIGAYSVSKTTLLGLCKFSAMELAKEGIRVNCIAPGGIKTRFLQPFYETPEACRETLKLIPMDRFGTSDEAAAAAAFLASQDASFITGETLVVAGGTSSRL